MATHPKKIESVRICFLFICVNVIFFRNDSHAQKELQFVPLYGNESIEIPFQSISDSLTITKIHWYIMQLRAFDSNTSKWVELVPCQLMNAEDSTSLRVVFGKNIKPSKLSFLLGTDSLTNVSAFFEGPLDPIHGMYWAWNSGFINFKLEGTQKNLATPGQGFEYHIGGYLPHQKTAQYVELEIPMDYQNESIVVGINMEKLFKAWDMKSHPTIMLPGPQAVRFAEQLPALFFVFNP